MWTSGKMRIPQIIIILVLLLSVQSFRLHVQPGNGLGDGPPSPPSGWCRKHPDDPTCEVNSDVVPVSDQKWVLGLIKRWK